MWKTLIVHSHSRKTEKVPALEIMRGVPGILTDGARVRNCKDLQWARIPLACFGEPPFWTEVINSEFGRKYIRQKIHLVHNSMSYLRVNRRPFTNNFSSKLFIRQCCMRSTVNRNNHLYHTGVDGYFHVACAQTNWMWMVREIKRTTQVFESSWKRIV